MHVANKAVALDLDAGLRGLHAAYKYLRLRGCSSPPGLNQTLYRPLSHDERATEIHSATGAPLWRGSSRPPRADDSPVGISSRGRCAATIYPRKCRASSGTRATSCLGCIIAPDTLYVRPNQTSLPACSPDMGRQEPCWVL